MTTTETAKQLRAEYKREGWNARMISVRVTHGGCDGMIRVEIKNVQVPFWKAKRMADDKDRIATCEITGEILSGGNIYVDVQESRERKEILARRHLQAVEDAIEKIPEDDNTIAPVSQTVAIHREDRYTIRLWINGADGWLSGMAFNYDSSNPDAAIEGIAHQVALYDDEQKADAA